MTHHVFVSLPVAFRANLENVKIKVKAVLDSEEAIFIENLVLINNICFYYIFQKVKLIEYS